MKTPFSIIILAAGRGTRMRSHLPKVLHEIVGVPMLRYCLLTATSLNPEKGIVVLGPAMDAVEQEVHASSTFETVIQPDAKGTGDAVKYALSRLAQYQGHILVMYGDTPFLSDETLANMLQLLDDPKKPAVVVLGFTPENPAEYGRLVMAPDGSLAKIVEFKDANDQERTIGFCNSGVMAIQAGLAFKLTSEITDQNAKLEYYLTDIVAIARKHGHTVLTLEAAPVEVMGINSRTDLAEAEGVMQSQLRWQAMENGVTMLAPETVYLQHDTELGKDITIHPYVVFGKGVTVDDGVEIKSHCDIEGAHIGPRASIGPFARIRPETNISANAKIGNFVELKKTEVGEGAKISHLSYVGDASVGKGANIGAGTITCNYDGYNKHRTEIGADAFIGSNSSLVAPVTIGAGAIIGAGSTILKSVEADAVAVSQMPQENRPGAATLFRQKNKKQ